MNFSVHVWVGVCVDVREDLGVDFGGTLGQEELLLLLLLLGQVLIVGHGGHAVLVDPRQWPLSGGLAVAIRESLSWDHSSRGTVLFRLAEPEQYSAQDEDYSSGDANDYRPGKARGWHGSDRGEVRFVVWNKKGENSESRGTGLFKVQMFILHRFATLLNIKVRKLFLAWTQYWEIESSYWHVLNSWPILGANLAKLQFEKKTHKTDIFMTASDMQRYLEALQKSHPYTIRIYFYCNAVTTTRPTRWQMQRAPFWLFVVFFCLIRASFAMNAKCFTDTPVHCFSEKGKRDLPQSGRKVKLALALELVQKSGKVNSRNYCNPDFLASRMWQVWYGFK